MNILQHAREQKNITQAEAAKDLDITAATLSRIERLISRPRLGLMQRIAQYYDISIEDIEALYNAPTDVRRNISSGQTTAPLGSSDLSPMEHALMESYRSGLVAARQSSDTVQIPVIGETAAGYGVGAQMESTDSTIALPREMLRNAASSYFALTVRGQSMEPELRDGDTVIIHQQNTLENGQIGLVVYGDDISSVGTYGTLKRVHVEPGRITLIPINPAYETITITGDDLSSVRIQGRLVHVLRSY